MPIAGAVIFPHPPLIFPEVGNGRERDIEATVRGCRAAASAAARMQPQTVVIASPHIAAYSDYFHLPPGKGARGSMKRFGAPQLRLEARYDERLRDETIALAQQYGLRAGTLGEREKDLDHGTFIPLWFLREAGVECPIVRVGLSGLSPLEHYALGQYIAEAAERLGRRMVFAASGDLSHRLSPDGPYGFAPEGPGFDAAVTEAMKTGDFLSFMTMPHTLCSKAGECGLGSFQMMAGALDGLAVRPRLLSYEGPFGVGYATAVFEAAGADENRRFAERYERLERERLDKVRRSEDEWVRLARLSAETYVRTGEMLQELPQGLPAGLTGAAAGVFVSLHIEGRLRGCIGTTGPTQQSTAWEIVKNAVSAVSADPRFEAVEPHELSRIEYKVDVLGGAEPVSSESQLDAARYGVIVSHRGKRGLLLPDLDGVDTVRRQIEIARQKAGIGENEPYTLERFEVVRHR